MTNLYSQQYPHYLRLHRIAWVLKNGDKLKIEEKEYKVVEVRRQVRGGHPLIHLEELKDIDGTKKS
jgi:hypothetical protein